MEWFQLFAWRRKCQWQFDQIEVFNETLSKKEGFYGNLNMEDTKDSDYSLVKVLN